MSKRNLIMAICLAGGLVFGIAFAGDDPGRGRGRGSNRNTNVNVNNTEAESISKASAVSGPVVNQNPVTVGGTTITDNSTLKAPASPPWVVPPALVTGNDVCVGAVSAGASGGNGFVSAGLSFGTTYTDENCVRLKNAHALAALGFKDAAISLLAKNKDVADALKAAGVPYKEIQPAGEKKSEKKAEVVIEEKGSGAKASAIPPEAPAFVAPSARDWVREP